MSALTFTLIETPEYELDLSTLTPDMLRGKTLDKIKAIKLDAGKTRISVSKIFKVTGRDTENLKFNNCTEKLSAIGKGLQQGTITVDGNVGDYLGQAMTGGEIHLKGKARDFVGANMRGGKIFIKGHVGDYLGAGIITETQGMNGGLISVSGNAGIRVGDRMRRGIIIIHGNAGDYCGARMKAGSIIVLKEVGKYSGYLMKRGTIILSRQPGYLTSTFECCGHLELTFLRLLFKQLAQMGQPLSKFKNFNSEAIRYAGDLANNGQGEIFILQAT